MKNRTVDFVLKQLRTGGATLHTSHEHGKTLWFLSNGPKPLADGVGEKVSQHRCVVGVGDALFAGCRDKPSATSSHHQESNHEHREARSSESR
jgi:hypothetical protein